VCYQTKRTIFIYYFHLVAKRLKSPHRFYFQAFVKEASCFSGRFHTFFSKVATNGDYGIIFLNDPDNWKTQRRFGSRALSGYVTQLTELREKVNCMSLRLEICWAFHWFSLIFVSFIFLHKHYSLCLFRASLHGRTLETRVVDEAKVLCEHIRSNEGKPFVFEVRLYFCWLMLRTELFRQCSQTKYCKISNLAQVVRQ